MLAWHLFGMRRRTEENPIESNGHPVITEARPFRDIFEQLPLACFCIDKQGAITAWNPLAEQQFGRKSADAIGTPAWEILTGVENREALRALISTALEGKSVNGSEIGLLNANGAACSYLFYGLPLRDQNGAVSGAACAQASLGSRQAAELLYSAVNANNGSIENAIEGIFQMNADTRLLHANPALARIFGYTYPSEFVAEHPRFDETLFLEKERYDEFMRALQGSEVAEEFESQIRRRDGSLVWIALNGRSVLDTNGALRYYEGSVENITKRKVAEERLLRHAFHDKLTGLPDRALFLDRLDQFIRRTKRNDAYTFAVLFVDLDRFKNVNDSLGHMMGDQLLVSTARKLEACLRPGDTVARLGGDEFAILLDDVKDITDATQLAERIQNRLIIPFSLNGQEVYSTASIGIAFGNRANDNVEELLHNADVAMYRAKSEGRARYEVFDTAMYARAKKLLQLEAELHRAVERNEFRVEYQPIVSLAMGTIVGFEALVRWQHPKRGSVPPGEFVSVAEDTGLIVPLGRWVLREACSQLARWQRSGRGTMLDLMMSVNLSVRQFNQPDLIRQIDGILKEFELDGSHLKLEITESVIMSNPDFAITVLKQLQGLKVKLSMDDFGTGYSSLSYLHKFPFNVLKIDRSFVSQMESSDKNEEIVRTIVNLAHNLNMEVIAEGVETYNQLDHLRALGCHYGQGYFFSGSMDAASATMLLRANPQW